MSLSFFLHRHCWPDADAFLSRPWQHLHNIQKQKEKFSKIHLTRCSFLILEPSNQSPTTSKLTLSCHQHHQLHLFALLQFLHLLTSLQPRKRHHRRKRSHSRCQAPGECHQPPFSGLQRICQAPTLMRNLPISSLLKMDQQPQSLALFLVHLSLEDGRHLIMVEDQHKDGS